MEDKNLEYALKLQKMIQMETISVFGKCDAKKFRPFHKILEGLFPTLFATCEKEDFNGSLLLRIKGKKSDKPILFMSHFDVVPTSENWSVAPFSGEIKDGKIWGRGTLDTKSSLFAFLEAIEELLQEGFVPENDIYFESACTEETDGTGAESIVKELKNRGITFHAVFDEGGFIVNDQLGTSDKKFAVIGLGEKGTADIKFIARSSGGHASTPPKNSPLIKLAKFMLAVEKSNAFTVYLNDITAEFLKRSAKEMKGIAGVLLRHPKFFSPLLKVLLPKLSNTAGAMLKTTTAFTMAKGSNGANVLPNEAWVNCNMRFSGHQGQKGSFDAIEKIAKKYGVEMKVEDPGFSSKYSDFHSEEFAKLESAIQKHFPNVTPVPYVMTGASDCRYFTEICDNCFRFAPFYVTDEQMATIHGDNENLTIETIAPAVEFYKSLMKTEDYHG